LCGCLNTELIWERYEVPEASWGCGLPSTVHGPWKVRATATSDVLGA
jgi:hypothetical protein